MIGNDTLPTAGAACDWLRAWRDRMGYTVVQAAEALGLSRARMTDNLYLHARPPSPRTLRLAMRLEHVKGTR